MVISIYQRIISSLLFGTATITAYLIFIVTGLDTNELPGWFFWLNFAHSDLLKHFLGFLVLNLQLMWAMWLWPFTAGYKYARLVIMGMCIGFSFLCEYQQLFTKTRTFDLLDLSVNLLPVFVLIFSKYTFARSNSVK